LSSPDTPEVLVDGETRDGVSAFDRGLQFGDGVFETIAVRRGEPLMLADHLERLAAGAGRLGIPLDAPPRALAGDVERLAAALARGVVKIVLTRGAGGRGYAPPAAPVPTRIVSAHGWPGHVAGRQQAGVRAGISPVRLSPQPLLAGIKHLNRLEQVLARMHWQDAWQEALMLDRDGRVIEATSANVFVVERDRIRTPPLGECGVAGLVRRRLLAAHPSGRPVVETPLTADDVTHAEEVFLTNCVIGAWPVTQVDDCRYAIGPVTRAVQDWLNEENLAVFD